MIHWPAVPEWGIPAFDEFTNGVGVVEPFSDETTSSIHSRNYVIGRYDEENEFSNLSGMNATLGALWVLNTHLTLGADVDFPWTAEARLKKTVNHTQTIYDESKTPC